MRELSFHSADELAHAYILVSPSPEERNSAAETIAAAALCSARGKVPCGLCRDCRKVREGIHPDLIRVSRLGDDKGRKKREIMIDQIRALVTDAVVLPNEAARKVYLIEDADTMNVPAQNAALKLLEEPPKGVHFLLCAANAGMLLETVRSRCAEIICSAREDEPDEELRVLAEAFLKRCAEEDEAELFRWCAANEGMDNAAAGAFCDCAAGLLRDMLCRRRSSLGMSERRLYDLEKLMERCLGMLRANVSVKHVFGLLAVDGVQR
jgi:DNA polymerase III delta prime subunit